MSITPKKLPLVISAPSGCGKSTLLDMLFKEFKGIFGFSISHTTREPRQGEINGKQYHFINLIIFKKMIELGEFVEHAEYSGNLYGTSFESIKNIRKDNLICVLEIEMEGIKLLKARKDFEAKFVFIKPPSLSDLEDRLRKRKTETEESIKSRLLAAKRELEYAETGLVHDFILINDDLEKSYKLFRSFIIETYIK